MKQLVASFIILFGTAITASAQYTEQLQQQKQGQGTVTVTQSKEIDDLVNGKPNKPATTTPRTTTTPATPRTTTTPAAPRTTTTTTTTATPVRSTTTTSPTSSSTSSSTSRREEPATTSSHEHAAATTTTTTRTTTSSSSSSSSSSYTEPAGRKVMRGAKRTQGYRVQVYSGGSTRDDRVKAEQIGNRMKSAFPNQPIYTHFYSTRWVCRMGNFKTYEEAMSICKKVRAMGYKQASVVKGSISVTR